MPEMHLRQPGLHIVLVDHLQKIKKEYKKLETGDFWHIYQNELDEACFQHDMAFWDFKDLTRQLLIKYCVTKYLILLKSKIWWIWKGFSFNVYKFFDKKTAGGATKQRITWRITQTNY